MNDATQLPGRLEGGEVGLVEPQDFVSAEPFAFESGGEIPGFTLRYETYGRLNRERSNAVLVCHALSGDHHCAGIHHLSDAKTGWWNNLIGPGKALDTRQYFVIGVNCLGGCQGSTGPGSVDPRTGRRYQLAFPVLSILDMVRAQARLLDHLGIDRLAAVIGGSMGGMQVLQWGVEFPDRVERMLAMATTARQNAQAIAFNEVGRCAIMQDPAWNGGDYEPGSGPSVGLAIARMMAHITYLSDRGMDEKFGRSRRAGVEAVAEKFGVEFEVESYLRYQGRSFTHRFDANTYLYFTKALDRFDLAAATGSLDAAFAPVRARTLVVGFSSDWLFPPSQNRTLVHALLRAGKEATYAELDTDLGHDSFLVESPELYDLVRAFLAGG